MYLNYVFSNNCVDGRRDVDQIKQLPGLYILLALGYISQQVNQIFSKEEPPETFVEFPDRGMLAQLNGKCIDNEEHKQSGMAV